MEKLFQTKWKEKWNRNRSALRDSVAVFFWHIVSAWNVLQKGIDDKLSIIIGFEVRFWKKVSPGDSKKEARANWENLQKS